MDNLKIDIKFIEDKVKMKNNKKFIKLTGSCTLQKIEHITNVAIEIGIAYPISPIYNPKQYLKYDIGLSNSLFS